MSSPPLLLIHTVIPVELPTSIYSLAGRFFSPFEIDETTRFSCRLAGTFGAVLTCPLEVIKTRYQSSRNSFTNANQIGEAKLSRPSIIGAFRYAERANSFVVSARFLFEVSFFRTKAFADFSKVSCRISSVSRRRGKTEFVLFFDRTSLFFVSGRFISLRMRTQNLFLSSRWNERHRWFTSRRQLQRVKRSFSSSALLPHPHSLRRGHVHLYESVVVRQNAPSTGSGVRRRAKSRVDVCLPLSLD